MDRLVQFGRITAALTALLVNAACSIAPRQPPGAPPTPSSITRATPGGDADDPEQAALLRQLERPWGSRRDKDNQLVVPLPDHKNYKRVRYWAIDHFVGFKYGDDHYVLNVVLIQDVPEGTHIDSRTCLRRAEKWAQPQMKAFEVKLGPRQTIEKSWHDQPIVVRTVDGYLDFGLKRRQFSAAYTAYAAYPNACMVFGMAVPWGKHRELAVRVRDRWVEEGVARIRPLTETRPYRK